MALEQILKKSVSQDADADTFGFKCPGIEGSRSCPPGGDDTWSTTGWPSKKLASERGREHLTEHKTGVAMPSLEEFRDGQGLGVKPDGSVVKVEDL